MTVGQGNRHTKNLPDGPENGVSDDGDGCDGRMHTDSNGRPLWPDGWAPERWVANLRRMADHCESDHPGRADDLRGQAARIELETEEERQAKAQAKADADAAFERIAG